MNRDHIKGFAGEFLKQYRDDDASGLGAELAFRWLFAVFPFVLFLAALGAFVASSIGIQNPAQQIIDALGDNLPPGLASAMQPELERLIGQRRSDLLSIGAVLALWAATSGTMTVIKAMNRAYGVEETRSVIIRYGIGIGLTIGAALGLMTSFVTIVGGSLLTEQVAGQLGLGSTARTVISILRWPVVFALLVLAVSVILRFGPNMTPSWKSTIGGSIVFALGWLMATIGFALYVSNLANYGATYGAMAGVIVLMLWFYVTALVLVAAGELVALFTRRTEPERLAERQDSIRADLALKKVAGAIGEKVDQVKRTLGSEEGASPADQRPVPAWSPASLPALPVRASRNELPDGVVMVALAVIGASVAFLTSRVPRR